MISVNFINGAGPASANPTSYEVPSKHLAQFVVDHLDLRTFPSSLGLRLKSYKVTFADYGITPVQISENKAVLVSPSHDWKYEVQVIKHDRASVTVCLHDLAQNGDNFNYESILLLRETGNQSLAAARNPWIAGGF